MVIADCQLPIADCSLLQRLSVLTIEVSGKKLAIGNRELEMT
jgi:hypothetical protein